ncbi:MAG: hypothetical protein KC609_18460 [Myxococcales bacterium]|nr:hypothetical protein [Myxococcales bacterium]
MRRHRFLRRRSASLQAPRTAPTRSALPRWLCRFCSLGLGLGLVLALGAIGTARAAPGPHRLQPTSKRPFRLTRDFGFVADSLRRGLRLAEHDERRVAALVAGLAGVARATVHLRLEAPNPLTALRSRPHVLGATVVAVLETTAQRETLEATIRQTVATALAVPARVVQIVLESAPTALVSVARAPRLASIGPLKVAPESRLTIVALLGALLFAVVVLAALLVVLLWRQRATRFGAHP